MASSTYCSCNLGMSPNFIESQMILTSLVAINDHTSRPLRCLHGCTAPDYSPIGTDLRRIIQGKQPQITQTLILPTLDHRIEESAQQVKSSVRLASFGQGTAECWTVHHSP